MTLLIATDEAGYGPKLGPLIIVATAWHLPPGVAVEVAFHNLSVPTSDPRCGTVHVDDSKRVFHRNQIIAPGHVSMLEVACRAASQWAAIPDPAGSFFSWLMTVAKSDCSVAIKAPWFADWPELPKTKQAVADIAFNSSVIVHWASSGLKLRGIHARLITAAAFNEQLDRGKNKADILTEATCRMAAEMIDAFDEHEHDVQISSDRHGGRAYYGAAIQHLCNGSTIRVLGENKAISRYHLTTMTRHGKNRDIDWSFCVGGDSFPPVAMSSMIAKWLRERAMLSFNKYFADRMPIGSNLRPTAGYPGDANRFIEDIQKVGLRESISDSVLIRRR